MNKKPFKTDQAPAAIGPYSQAIESNGFLFLSGQIPIDPKTNTVIPSPSIIDQTRRVLQNIENILKARDLSLAHVIKTTIFLKNISDFQKMNEVYASFFSKKPADTPPARSAVEVARLPKDVLIEIEAIATLT